MPGEEDWKARLTPEQYKVLRECSTEPPFTGKYHDHHEEGVYLCAACHAELFSSKDKFDSGTGWPSFTKPTDRSKVKGRVDLSHGMVRKEIVCSKCGGHLGHVFDDGPGPGGMRYCVNSAALDFRKDSGREA